MDTEADHADVLLCSMPFGLVATPSLALGLLHASVQHLPLRTRQVYFSLKFASMIGDHIYRTIARRWEVGDWVFADAAFPGAGLDVDAFVDRILFRTPAAARPSLAPLAPEDRDRDIAASAEAGLAGRRAAAAFIEECADSVERLAPRLVGFSCMFQQRIASLALARRIKAKRPDTLVVFGGAEVYGVLGVELVRQCDAVDAVVSGPGDVVFPEIVRRAWRGEALDDLPGVYTRSNAGATQGRHVHDAPPPGCLDDLPYPVFADFLADCETVRGGPPADWYLSLETSRGCWWGAQPRRHCTFCSLNAGHLGYAAKSPGRVGAEVSAFARTYPGVPIAMTDSAVNVHALLDASRELAAGGVRPELQYEMRVTVTRDDLRQLRAAGVVRIQGGIESLSTPILSLLRKGTTALQNIQFLKWANEAGIAVMWNFLCGIPLEPPSAYATMERLIPLLSHLSPPMRVRYVLIEPHSPLFDEADALGVKGLVPDAAHRYIWPFPAPVIANLAIRFSHDVPDWNEVDRYSSGAQEAVALWQRNHSGSDLLSIDDGVVNLVLDRRPVALAPAVRLEGLDRIVHLACERIRRVASLLAEASKYFPDVSQQAIEATLASLAERRLVIGEDGRWLALAKRVLDGQTSGTGGLSPNSHVQARQHAAATTGGRTPRPVVELLAPGTNDPAVFAPAKNVAAMEFHRAAFAVETDASYDALVRLVADSVDCTVESSCKVDVTGTHASRWNLFYHGRHGQRFLMSVFRFLDELEGISGVTLDRETLEQTITDDMGFQDVTKVITGLDVRDNAAESRVKLWFMLRGGEPFVTRAMALDGDRGMADRLRLHDEFLVGFDLGFDGTVAVKLYPDVRPAELHNRDVRRRLKTVLSDEALAVMGECRWTHLYLSRQQAGLTLHCHPFDPDAFVAKHLPASAAQIHAAYQGTRLLDMVVALPCSEAGHGPVSAFSLYYMPAQCPGA